MRRRGYDADGADFPKKHDAPGMLSDYTLKRTIFVRDWGDYFPL
jgi:hypothetical protein